jgi:hypothetical protein
VGVKYDPGGGGSPAVFRDTFTRANGGIGPNYVWIPTGAALTGVNTAEGLWGVSANAGLLNNVTGSTQQMQGWLFPYVDPTSVLGQAQFIEMQIKATSTAGFNLVVMGTPMVADGGYSLRLNSNGIPNKLTLNISGGAGIEGAVVQDPFDGGVAFAVNDVVRLSVVPGVASNLVKAWINGVVVASRVDATVGRPVQTGMPALACSAILTATSIVFDNLRCGAGEG